MGESRIISLSTSMLTCTYTEWKHLVVFVKILNYVGLTCSTLLREDRGMGKILQWL